MSAEKVRLRYVGSDYKIDLFHDLKKYWMVFGVLASVALAVLAPHVGAPGGVLQTQYVWYVAAGYVWYNAGRRGVARPPLRAALAAALHAALVVPALRLLLPLDDHLHHQHGLSAETEGGLSWLSVALCEDEAAAGVTLVASLAVLGGAPLGSLAVCGRGALPALGAALGGGAACAGAWGAGAWRGGGGGGRGARLAALVLVYVQCCGSLAARGPWAAGAVARAAAAEAGWAGAGAALCGAYRRAGLDARGAALVALCAVPRALAAGGWCAARGPAAALRAPAAALLFAALAVHQPRA